MTPSRTLFAGLSAALLLFACGRQPQAGNLSRFAATPPTIDGQTTDWGPDSLRYDADSKLQYQVLNDQRAVYIRLKAANPQTQGRLLHQGFTVWLDTTGRNQQQFGVRFVLPREPIPAEGTGGSSGSDDRHSRLSRALAGAREMELLYRKVPVLASGEHAVVGITVLSNRQAMANGTNSSGMSVVGADGMSNGSMGGGRGGYGGGRGGYGGGGMRGGMPGGGYGGPQPLVLKTTAKLSAQ